MRDRVRTTLPMLATAVLLHFGGAASATTWNVLEDGTGDAPTIQAAVDSALFGDTVLVHPGTYTDVTFDLNGGYSAVHMKDGVVLRGMAGSASTSIDVESGDVTRGISCFFCGPATVIEGFTFLGGDEFNGAAIYVFGGAPVIRNNLFFEAYGGAGGAVAVAGANPVITNNVFDSNTACCGVGGAMFIMDGSAPLIRENLFTGNDGFGGGAVAFDNSNGVLEDNEFVGNLGTDGGALAVYGGAPKIKGNTFRMNESATDGGAVAFFFGTTALFVDNLLVGNSADGSGGGITVDFASPTIRSNTIVENSGGGAGGLYLTGNSSVSLDRNVVAFNHGNYGVSCDDPSVSASFTCNDFFGNDGAPFFGFCPDPTGTDGNIAEEPLFCSGVYEPQSCSPLVTGPCGLIGAFDTGCDCDVTSTESASWGMVKKLFR